MSKPKKILCLDTNILIWGILSNGKTPKEKEMINKAQAFLKEKFDEKCPLAISVISLAEFMVKIPNEDKNKYLEIFEQNFIIFEFNKNTALKAAKIFKKEYGQRKRLEYKSERQFLRADIQILASILQQNNITLLTEDQRLFNLAGKYISVQTLPDPTQKQLPLFE